MRLMQCQFVKHFNFPNLRRGQSTNYFVFSVVPNIRTTQLYSRSTRVQALCILASMHSTRYYYGYQLVCILLALVCILCIVRTVPALLYIFIALQLRSTMLLVPPVATAQLNSGLSFQWIWMKDGLLSHNFFPQYIFEGLT